ncbi:MAG: hypothetical protein ACRCXH_03820 [Shewanella sp.]
MSFLPFLTNPPAERYETIGNSRTGTLKIRSISAISEPEMEFIDANKQNWYMQLASMARSIHAEMGKRYKFEDVFDTLKAPLLNQAPKVDLGDKTLAFQPVYDKIQRHNSALMAVAILRNRVPGMGSLTIEQFKDESKVPAAMQRLLVEFAANESEGWPDDKDSLDTVEAPVANAAPTEDEAVK